MASLTEIKSFERIIPMIYAYNTPGVSYNDGWTKIGYTDRQDVRKRIEQQTHTAGIQYKIAWQDNAMFKDGSGEYFTDHDFHAYLTKHQVPRREKLEWFQIDGPHSQQMFNAFATHDFGKLPGQEGTAYILREEQARAVEQTAAYYESHLDTFGRHGEFLWNAKPRFGKTLAAYDFVRRIGARNVLIVTNRPSIANSWYDDFARFIAWQTHYQFVSDSDSLAGQPVLSRKEYLQQTMQAEQENDMEYGQIAFESLQGLKGSKYFGGTFDKLDWIQDMKWDVLIIDEAHEGVDTYKTDRAFEQIKREFTLHLSGTPFKALARGKFHEDQIFNWSYADEQAAKEAWDADGHEESNPYGALPRLLMFTYQMSGIVEDKLRQGLDLDESADAEYAFDLNEFFRVENDRFVHAADVAKFLDALTVQTRFPFSTPELRDELRHTFWLLNRVDSAKALARMLAKHPVFSAYEIVVAAGDGRLNEAAADTDKSLNRVREAIRTHDRTITLSVGQLTTGVTIPEWTGVLMLSNMQSPAEYMQAAFRAQNPYQVTRDGQRLQKERAYVFDFDPARTLIIFDQFANNLLASMADGNGTVEARRENIRRLLNFFPVIAEDADGEMVELDAAQVMSIPRRIKSQEVVKRGFMSNFLFNNIANVFGAPQAVLDVLNKLTPAKDVPRDKKAKKLEDAPEVPVDGAGNVEIPDEKVIGLTQDVFGPKIYGTMTQEMDGVLQRFTAEGMQGTDAPAYVIKAADEKVQAAEELKEKLKETVSTRVVDTVQAQLGDEDHPDLTLRPREAQRIREGLEKQIEAGIQKHVDTFTIVKNVVEKKHEEDLQAAESQEDVAKADAAFQESMTGALQDFTSNIQQETERTIQAAPQTVIRHIEEKKAERDKRDVMNDIRDHLRGFTRTIPSFIMAYGDQDLRLANFEDYTEEQVFEEVTGITEENFRFLRDGGDVDGEHFDGHFFDEVVFNDSIQEFLHLKMTLNDYFNEKKPEDIFDYIPPQKTNQIFTPKVTVKMMVDKLAEQNPGIFDDPDKTFADLYMKSGLYITEIVKRLFNSEKMKQIFPDEDARIRHILEHQVYGLAPSRIIYLIATNYIFGFNDAAKDISRAHFKQLDALQYAKEGNLAEVVRKAFGDDGVDAVIK